MMRYNTLRDDLSLRLVAALDRQQAFLCIGEGDGH